MIFKDIKPDLIYVELQSVIKDLINTIEASEVETTDKEIATFSRNLLNELDANIAGELDKLKANSEWDTFTVAFYGETNAGKSTIIETLRILLAEPQKVSSQNKFKELATTLNIDSASFEKINQEIAELKDNKVVLEQSLNSVKDKSNEQLSSLKNELATLNKTIESKLAAFNIFQKIWHFFSKLPEEAQIVTKQEQFETTKLILDENVAQAENEVSENDERYNAACLKLEHMQGELEKLVPYADGAIIGDGRSDYTLDSQSYSMQGDESTFTVLDVPGIEGKEEKVGESIWSAVHKAHAVFYVTSKAAAPQTGDDKNKGTLEKIKEHLGDQTEVYSIYNKRITNPLQLQKSQLVSESELASLAELDAKMADQLGENYQGTKSVCGLVGYLAAANCLVAGSADHKRKEKAGDVYWAAPSRLVAQSSGCVLFDRHVPLSTVPQPDVSSCDRTAWRAAPRRPTQPVLRHRVAAAVLPRSGHGKGATWAPCFRRSFRRYAAFWASSSLTTGRVPSSRA